MAGKNRRKSTLTPEQRKAHRDAKKARANEIMDVAVGVAEEDMDAVLAFAAQLKTPRQAHGGGYSAHNILMILAQRPDATEVCGFNAWAARGRAVKKGEHGIMIVRPGSLYNRKTKESISEQDAAGMDPADVGRMFATGVVFDIAQTEEVDWAADKATGPAEETVPSPVTREDVTAVMAKHAEHAAEHATAESATA